MAAEEYHAEFAQKESTIAMLTADAEKQRVQHQEKIDKLRSDMEVCPGPLAIPAMLQFSFSGANFCMLMTVMVCMSSCAPAKSDPAVVLLHKM